MSVDKTILVKAKYPKNSEAYKALRFAAAKHKGQVDKCGVAYILHPIRVASYLLSDDDELRAIALLHDVMEDCGVTEYDLRIAGFSERVVTGVKLLTKAKDYRYFDYIRDLIASKNLDVLYVKLADLRDNSDPRRVWAVGDPKSIVRRYHKAAIMIYTELDMFS